MRCTVTKDANQFSPDPSLRCGLDSVLLPLHKAVPVDALQKYSRTLVTRISMKNIKFLSCEGRVISNFFSERGLTVENGLERIRTRVNFLNYRRWKIVNFSF